MTATDRAREYVRSAIVWIASAEGTHDNEELSPEEKLEKISAYLAASRRQLKEADQILALDLAGGHIPTEEDTPMKS